LLGILAEAWNASANTWNQVDTISTDRLMKVRPAFTKTGNSHSFAAWLLFPTAIYTVRF
jgi:hypothetical protein